MLGYEYVAQLTRRSHGSHRENAVPSTATTGGMLLRPEQAAQELNIGRTGLYELMASGELESVKIGRSRRVPRAALAAYIDRLRGEQAAA